MYAVTVEFFINELFHGFSYGLLMWTMSNVIDFWEDFVDCIAFGNVLKKSFTEMPWMEWELRPRLNVNHDENSHKSRKHLNLDWIIKYPFRFESFRSNATPKGFQTSERVASTSNEWKLQSLKITNNLPTWWECYEEIVDFEKEIRFAWWCQSAGDW